MYIVYLRTRGDADLVKDGLVLADWVRPDIKPKRDLDFWKYSSAVPFDREEQPTDKILHFETYEEFDLWFKVEYFTEIL